MNEQRLENTDLDSRLLGQVRESFGRVAYSQKTHEKQADICFRRHRAQQSALVALTALSSGTFLASVFDLLGNPVLTSAAISFTALLVSWISLAVKTFKFEEEAKAHRGVASQLWGIRESYISLISDLMSGAISIADGRKRRDELQQITRDCYVVAPRTGKEAFDRARRGLKENEEMTFSVKEIDLLLPEALRLGKGW